jgi:uncharacterized protein
MVHAEPAVEPAADSAAPSAADQADERRPSLTVTVAFSPAATLLDEAVLQLAAGTTVADALRSSGLAERHPHVALDALPCGVWGVLCSRDAVLRDHDRIELYRPLQVDPMQARRKRQSLQRSKLGARR